MEFKSYRLGELCKRLSSGKSITANLIKEQGIYPVYGANGLRGYTDTYNFDGECAVIGRQGAYCGNVKYVTGKVYMSEHAVVAEANTSNDSRYLAYKLNLLQLGRFSGQAAQPGLSVQRLSRLLLIIHDKKSQQKIANILFRYDEAIENNNKRIKLLEQMAQNLYKEWFVRFRFPGWQYAEFENGIPKGWKVKQLKDFGRIETGKTPSMEDDENYGNDFLFIKTPDLHKSMFVFDTEEKLSEKGHKSQISKSLPKNSIMVSCIGTAGIVSINMKEGHTNQQINSIILNDITELEWLFYTCKSLKETIELFGATGATMTNLSKGKFEKLKLIYPEKDILTKYHRITKPIFDEIQRLLIINQNLAKQRDLLLPRLMSGKLEVK